MWTKAEQTEAIEQLRKYLEPGDTVYTTLKHVSRSGMYRALDVHIIKDNEPMWLPRLVAKAIGARFDDRYAAVGIGGVGMDMGFKIVYNLGYYLFPNGFGEVGQASLYPQGIRAGSKKHADLLNGRGVRFYGRNGDTSGWDNDGGYALKQRWL